MKVHGSCHCGAITYEAVIDPQMAGICHCADCQTFSGAPFRAVVPTKAEDFVLGGTPRIYVKVAQSGRRRAQAFCGECGASIYSADAEGPSLYNLRLGSLRERAQIPACKQVWRTSALEWAQNVSLLPVAPQSELVEPEKRGNDQ